MLFDQPETLAPGNVLDWHALCTAGLDQERRTVRERLLTQSPIPEYLSAVFPVGTESDEIDSYFASCRQELDLSVVLTLIAAAEGRIRLDARRRVNANAHAGSDQLAGRLKLLFSGADNDWAVPLYESGIMEAWKEYTATLPSIPEQDKDRIRTCIGRLKDMLRVRHWVAHGRYWKLSGGGIERYPPATVAKAVASMYQALDDAAARGRLTAFR
jgi:hypothetical protein